MHKFDVLILCRAAVILHNASYFEIKIDLACKGLELLWFPDPVRSRAAAEDISSIHPSVIFLIKGALCSNLEEYTCVNTIFSGRM